MFLKKKKKKGVRAVMMSLELLKQKLMLITARSGSKAPRTF